MIDGFVLLAPLLLMPIVLLLVFLGCKSAYMMAASPLMKVTAVLGGAEDFLQEVSRVKFRWTIDGDDAGEDVLSEPTDEGRFELVIKSEPSAEEEWQVFCIVWALDNIPLAEVPSPTFELRWPELRSVMVIFQMVLTPGGELEPAFAGFEWEE